MLEDSGDEQETNGIVNKVLDEIGIEMSGKVFIQHICINDIICRATHELRFLPSFQMANAPSAISDSIGASTNKMSEKDIEAQLAKLRST